jgi:hypothetical protein
MTDTEYIFFVVAPSYQWFTSWCQDEGIHPRNRNKVIYISHLSQIQGLRLESEKQIIDLGPFDPKRYDLVLALQARVRKGKSAQEDNYV